MMLAFFQTHLVGDDSYRLYMQPAYAAYLSRNQKFKLYLISVASNSALKGAIAEFRSRR